MIEPLRFHNEKSPSFCISDPAFCGLCQSQKQYRHDPQIAIKYCPECPRRFLCSRCDDEAHREALTKHHIRRMLVIGPGVRKKLVKRGDARNFPLPMDNVFVKVSSKQYLMGKLIGKEKPQDLYFQVGLSGHTIHVQVLGARGIPAADFGGTSDPVISATFEGRSLGSTRVRQRTLNPDWDNETFVVPISDNRPSAREMAPSQKDLFKLELYDYDVWGNDFLGHIEIHREELIELADKSLEQPIRLPFTSKEFHGFCFFSFGVKEVLPNNGAFSFLNNSNEDEETKYNFVIRVDRAENLDKLNAVGYSDPLCKIYFGNKLIGETPHLSDTCNPVWNEKNEFTIPIEEFIEREDELILEKRRAAIGGNNNFDDSIFKITLEDYNYWMPNRALGEVSIPVHAIRSMGPIDGLPEGKETVESARSTKKKYSDEDEEDEDEDRTTTYTGSTGEQVESEIGSGVSRPEEQLQIMTDFNQEDEEQNDFDNNHDESGGAEIEAEIEEYQDPNLETDEFTTENEKPDSTGDYDNAEEQGQDENKQDDGNEEGEDDDDDDEDDESEEEVPKSLFQRLFFCCAGQQLLLKKPEDPTIWSPQMRFSVEKESKSAVDVEGDNRGQVVVRLLKSTRGNVITGLDEGVRAMSLGETANLKVRFDHAYGSYLMGAQCPPRANIVFTVQLRRINGEGYWSIPWRQFLRCFRMSKRNSIRLFRFTTLSCRAFLYLIKKALGKAKDNEDEDFTVYEDESLLESSDAFGDEDDDEFDDADYESEEEVIVETQADRDVQALIDKPKTSAEAILKRRYDSIPKTAHLGAKYLWSHTSMPKPKRGPKKNEHDKIHKHKDKLRRRKVVEVEQNELEEGEGEDKELEEV